MNYEQLLRKLLIGCFYKNTWREGLRQIFPEDTTLDVIMNPEECEQLYQIYRED